MHNVRPGLPRLCLGKLDLSNTPVPRKTLSFAKPPRQESSFAASRTVLDGIEAPGKGNGGTLQGPSLHRSALFLTVPSKEAYYRPRGPVPI